MNLKTGMRIRSTTCDTEVIVVRAPDKDLDLSCGGHPMATKDDASSASHPLDDRFAEGTQIGKRYADEDLGLELLVTKAGRGSLCVDGEPLPLKDAKPLPSSD